MRRTMSCFILSASVALSPTGAFAKEATTKKTEKSATSKRAPAKAASRDKKADALKKPARIRPGSTWFLSHAEFTRLTKREQKEYLRGVRKVLGSLPSRSENFGKSTPTGEKARKTASVPEVAYTPEQIDVLVKQAEGWRGEESLLRPSLLFDSYARDKHRERMRNSIWWLVNARLGVNELPDSDPKKADLVRRINTLEANYLDYGKSYAIDWLAWDHSISAGLKALDSARNKRIDMTCQITPHNALYLHGNGQAVVPSGGVATEPASLKACEENKARLAAEQEKSREEASTAPESAETLPPENPPEVLGYRCMYSGFVIKEDPCRGPAELPSDMTFKGINSSSFLCEDDQIMCNPLLFGVVADCELKADGEESKNMECLGQARPLCMPRDKYATQNCATQSASDKSLESAALLIKMNPALWRDYRISFFELCDDEMIAFNGFVHRKNGESTVPEKTLNDVRQTCSSAKSRLAELVNTYRIDGERPQRTGQPAATDGDR